jgi:hypothetical protein
VRGDGDGGDVDVHQGDAEPEIVRFHNDAIRASGARNASDCLARFCDRDAREVADGETECRTCATKVKDSRGSDHWLTFEVTGDPPPCLVIQAAVPTYTAAGARAAARWSQWRSCNCALCLLSLAPQVGVFPSGWSAATLYS